MVELSIKELVDKYGNSIHKAMYNNGNLAGGSRKSFLTYIKRFIDYSEGSKRGYFIINNIYDIEKPTILINYSKDDIYYHVARMITEHLNVTESNTCKVIPKVRFSNDIQFINSNFNRIRYNKKYASDLLNIDELIIKDFTKKAIENMESVIETTLKLLKSNELIEYLEQYMVGYTSVEFDRELNKNITVSGTRRATESEILFILKTIEDTKKKFNITSQEIYFSKNKKTYSEFISLKLKEINIDFYFKGYEVYYLDKQRVLNFLSWYDGSVIDNIKKANELFINKLNLNTSKRISLKSIDSEDYMSKYLKLCEHTIPYDSELLDIDYKDSYNVSIDIINNGMGVNVNIERNNILD